MAKGISIQPIKIRQANKVVKHKTPRNNIHNSFRHDHKPAEVRTKHEHLKELKQQMQHQFAGVEEGVASKLDTII